MWKVLLNGSPFDLYTHIKFSRSIDNNAGYFSIESSENNQYDSPLKANDLVEIFFDNQKCFTGFAEKIIDEETGAGAKVTYIGRDTLLDAVDSSMPDEGKNKKGSMSLISICQDGFKHLGMKTKVIDTTNGKVGAQKVTQQQTTCEQVDKVIQRMTRMATKLQVWLVANEDGDLEILRAGERKLDLPLYFLLDGKGKNNILESKLKIDMSHVFHTIKVRGKGSIAHHLSSANANSVWGSSSGVTKKLSDVNGVAHDDTARASRYLEISSNDTLTSSQATQRAKDEVNFRKAKAFIYKVKTNFFTQKNGDIIKIGGMCEIQDELRQVNGKYLIRDFDVMFDRAGGTIVDIAFAPPEAYQIIDIENRQNKIHRGRHRRGRKGAGWMSLPNKKD